MPTPKISAETLLKLKSVFEYLEWDTRTDPAFNRFSETLEFLTVQQQTFLLDLTKKFLRIDIGKYHIYLKKALEKIDHSTLENIETIYVSPLIAKKDLGKSKSSSMMARFLVGRELNAKEILGVKSLSLIDRMSSSKMPVSDKWLFILVDDFIGTGETAEEAIDEFLVDFGVDKSKLIVLSLVSQEVGCNKILDKGIAFVCAEIRKKGISGEFPSPMKEEFIDIMTSIEDIIKVKDEFRLGYKGSEALVTMDRTPNNTFPVYWLEKKIQGRKFTAPFPRD